MDPPEETVEESLDPPEDGIVSSEEVAVPLKTLPPANSLQTQVSQFWMLQALICTASSLKQDALAPKMASYSDLGRIWPSKRGPRINQNSQKICFDIALHF